MQLITNNTYEIIVTNENGYVLATEEVLVTTETELSQLLWTRLNFSNPFTGCDVAIAVKNIRTELIIQE